MVDAAPVTPGTPASGDATRGLGKAIESNFSPEVIAKVVLTLDNASSEMLKSFGRGQEMADILRISMSNSVTEVRKLGGDIADVLTTQKSASEALGRNVILSEKTTKDLFATMKVTGVEVGKIVAGMADVGVSSVRATNEMLKIVNVARESGVNAQAVSAKVVDNMNALNKFNFAGGVEGLAKMAAQATALRVDMSATLGLADKLFDPDKAIDMAASMQRLGVSQSSLLDPLKLMDLAQNDPAELQNQIAQMSKQFVQLGKDGNFEIMPGAKRQLREISSAMGMTNGELEKMALGGANLDKKLKEITFPSATEDQKKMIANMAEMGEGGTYEIKTAAGDTKKVSDLTTEEIKALEKMASAKPESMEELAKQQLSATQAVTAAINSLGDRTGLGLASSQTAGGILKGTKAVARAVQEIPGEGLSAKNIGKATDKFIDTINGAIEEYANTGRSTLDLGKVMSDFSGFIDKELKESFSNVKNQADKLDKEFPALGNLAKALEVSVGASQPRNVTSNIPTGGVGTNSMNGSQSSTQTSKMDVNLNHTINITAPPGIDTKTLQTALNETDVKNQIIKMVQDTVKDSIGRPMPEKNGPR
jgi:hypothetical protein